MGLTAVGQTPRLSHAHSPVFSPVFQLPNLALDEHAALEIERREGRDVAHLNQLIVLATGTPATEALDSHGGASEGSGNERGWGVRTGSSLSPRCFTRYTAIWCCCGGEQCISSERMTGNSDVTNAHSLIALATASKSSVVQKVWPWVTIGPASPSQQSIST